MPIDRYPPTAVAETAHQPTDVSRRNLLRGATLAAGGAAFLAATMTAQRAEAKMAQTAAGYQTTPKDGKRCSDCAVFVAPSSCRLVDGTISPEGYCRFFVKKS
jgi:hypothetical protein